ncbi:hypothetical protein GCM10025862_21530 [Arsenicicoccus piscis]|uniref:Uncharacterized protein n=1 Tax=Arsenicicoccus piscis TaxID=673954 RepID=A0ABQ6HQ74_9MICO|nr:hypothetical protein GCM10025862_21530 [Arsenicicoccus piscis]
MGTASVVVASQAGRVDTAAAGVPWPTVLVLGAPPGEGLVAAEPAGLVLIVRTIAAVLPEKRAAAVRTTAAVRPRPSASCPSRWRPLLVVDISNFLLLALGPDDGQTPEMVTTCTCR